jgi:hypothetical protein
MKPVLLAAAAIAALAAAPAAAQHAGHGAPAPTPAAEPAQPPVDHSAHQMPAEEPAPVDHSAHQTAAEPQAEQPAAEDHSAHAGHAAATPDAPHHAMQGAYGPYSANREASGTSWQPDTSHHGGISLNSGGWHLMGHGVLNGVYSWQEGPRGDEDVFVSGMLMGMARRDFSNGNVLQFRAALSPDPLMGKRGYPLLLAAGETANGVTPLIDRQHPHELVMELSASYSVKLGERASVFLYGGLPGEPAFGPPAFMHRMSAMDSPEAPITHHWLDSTHIAFGVLTAGAVVGDFKLEASRFNGREPDQHRYDIETGPLDSTAVRVSWNPTRELSLQGSWGRFISPEQLEPDENQTRWSASAIYTKRLGDKGWWSTTAAWGRRSADHDQLDAFALESAAGLGLWTIFGRAERIETNELVQVGGHHGPVYTVGKVSAGVIRDFRIADHVKFGVGGLFAQNFVPRPLEALYAGEPKGAMAFVRLKID